MAPLAQWPSVRHRRILNRAALDRVEVLGERLEVPRDARREGVDVHVLDVHERAGEQLTIRRPARGDRESAVAGDDRRHTVEVRRRERRVPEDLGVVMRMDVDEDLLAVE